jgi:hypothetical protein
MNPQRLGSPEIRHWLQETNFTPILDLAKESKRVLSFLTALSYDMDPEISARAITAAGLVASIISGRDPEYVRNTLLRLFWLVNDESGGIGWKAPELIGEILYRCPQFDQFFPMLIALLGLEEEDAPRFRLGTLWAIGRVALVAREAMLPVLQYIQQLPPLENDPESKEMMVWCMDQLNSATPR